MDSTLFSTELCPDSPPQPSLDFPLRLLLFPCALGCGRDGGFLLGKGNGVFGSGFLFYTIPPPAFSEGDTADSSVVASTVVFSAGSIASDELLLSVAALSFWLSAYAAAGIKSRLRHNNIAIHFLRFIVFSLLNFPCK